MNDSRIVVDQKLELDGIGTDLLMPFCRVKHQQSSWRVANADGPQQEEWGWNGGFPLSEGPPEIDDLKKSVHMEQNLLYIFFDFL